MSRTAQFAISAATNYGRMLISLLSVALLMPYIVAKIGNDQFGLWGVIFAALGFLNLLDLGFGTGVVKYVAECHATGDIERRNRILSTLAGVYAVISLISLVSIVVLVILFDRVFSVPAPLKPLAIPLLWILGARFLLAIPLGLFRNAMYGEQKIYQINIFQAVGTIVYAIGSFVVLWMGFGIIAWAWVNLAAMLVEYVGYVWYSYATMPQLHLSRELIDKQLLKETASFSSSQLLINVASLILLRTDPLIVKAFLPFSAVAIYAVPLKISEQAYLLAKQFTNLLAPMAVQLKQKAEEQKIRFLLVNCTKFAMAPTVMMAIAMYVLGRESLAFYMKRPEYGDGGPVLTVLLTAMALGMPQLTASAVLSMTGHHKITAKAAILEVVINVGMSVLLVRYIGLVGVAAGTLAAGVLIDFPLTIRRACDIHGITYISYIRRALLPAILPGIPQFAITLALKTWSPPAGLISTIILCIPGAVVYMALFWSFSIEASEKHLLVSKLLRRKRPASAAAGD